MKAKRPKPGVVLLAGFSMIGLGFLTGPAAGDTVDDALRCFEDVYVLESQRDGLLFQADSLGARIEARRSDGGAVPEEWLRAAERLQGEALEREMDILQIHRRCRELSVDALEVCRARIAELTERVGSGGATAEEARRLQTLREIRDRLTASAAGSAVLGYPLLPPEPGDTQESLRTKLQYHQDVSGYLERLDDRVASRLETLEDERRVLAEARRFVRDLAFLDEGGRIEAGGSARVRGGLPGDPIPGGGAGRVSGSAEIGSGGGLDFVLSLTPSSPEESDRLIELLQGFRGEIRGEREAISQATRAIERRIRSDAPAPR